MLSDMFPYMSSYEFIDEIYVVYDNSNTIGYAYIAQGKGYGGYIDILVGLEDETTIKGINIIKHSESPGLGARIVEDEYRNQYIDLNISDSEINFNGGQIDSITGATISSKAVADAVRTTALQKVQELFGKGGDQDE
jgi:electron transport complex protein RnfG